MPAGLSIPNKFFTKHKAVVKIFLMVFFFVAVMQAVGTLSLRFNRQKLQDFQPWLPAYSNFTVPLFARWDSGWYVSIVKDNYALNPGQNSNVTFLPLYPLSIKLLSLAFPVNLFYLGLFVSWAALLLAMVFFYKLLSLDLPENQALKILTMLLVYPWSFFLAAVYTESLFLFFAVTSLYLSRKQHWAGAAVLGLAAGLTRISGIFLLPALLLEYFLHYRKLQLRAAWLLLIPCGPALFAWYLKLQ